MTHSSHRKGHGAQGAKPVVVEQVAPQKPVLAPLAERYRALIDRVDAEKAATTESQLTAATSLADLKDRALRYVGEDHLGQYYSQCALMASADTLFLLLHGEHGEAELRKAKLVSASRAISEMPAKPKRTWDLSIDSNRHDLYRFQVCDALGPNVIIVSSRAEVLETAIADATAEFDRFKSEVELALSKILPVSVIARPATWLQQRFPGIAQRFHRDRDQSVTTVVDPEVRLAELEGGLFALKTKFDTQVAAFLVGIETFSAWVDQERVLLAPRRPAVQAIQ